MNLINELRMLAEDLYVNGYSRYSSAMAQAADELEKLQRYRTAYNEWIDKTEWMQEGMPAKYLGMHRADILKDMVNELRDRLEAAEKERDAAELMSLALRAKIEQMEKQEPIATLHDDGYFTWVASRPYESGFAGWRMKVYALPGAKGEEK